MLLDKVSQYYKNLFQRFHNPESAKGLRQPKVLPLYGIHQGKGVLIYRPQTPHCWLIRDALNDDYYIINARDFLPGLKDRQMVYFALQTKPEITNISREGTSAIALKISQA